MDLFFPELIPFPIKRVEEIIFLKVHCVEIPIDLRV